MKTKILNTLVTASMLLLAATAANAQTAYSNAIVNLNPAGYWPMHEVEAAAQGDIETNYGSLGLLGTGFYPDWAVNSGAFARQVAGALADDSDTALHFKRLVSSGAGAAAIYTNQMYIPHTSPLSTLNPPFSVEMWYYPTNTSSQTFWGEFGDEALNGGNEGHNDGAWSGIILVYNGAFTVYGENNGVQTGFGNTTEPVNNWYHLVVTCDANTNVTLYINGSMATTAAGVGKYSPDYWTPMGIGGSRGGTRSCPGSIDEFAVYTNVISDIAQHYSDGTNAAPVTSYYHDVTNDNPLIYLRMDAPNYSAPAANTWPVLNNYGTTNGVAVGNGVYTPGTMPGIVTNPIANPNGVPFRGVTNILAQLSGVSSFGDAGFAPVYNPTGSNANFTVTAIFRGNPADNRVESIVGHGTNSWQMSLTTNGCIVFNAGNGNNTAAGGTGQAAGDRKTAGVYNDGNWHQVVAVNTTNVISIYVDGLLDTNGTPAGIASTNIIPGNTGDVMVGADPSYTNNPPGVGRQFAGQVCDVAFFTNALTLSQIQTLYSNCEVAPYITTQPQSYAVNQGVDFTNMGVVAKGSPNLSYQWFTNGVALAGQTAPNLVLNPVVSANASADYYVIVTNLYGSATSSVVSLSVFATPLFTELLPITYNAMNNTNYLTLYPGGSPRFAAMAAGAQPIGYFWFTNGVNLAGQNSTNFTLANVQIGTNNVSCIASNSLGTATNTWNLSVIAAPTNSMGGPAPYPQQVLALNPIAYWRLNDYILDEYGQADNGNGDDGYYANDYVAGNNGLYTNVYLGQTSYSPGTDPSDSSVYLYEFGGSFPNVANNFAGGIYGIDFATTNGANAEFTVEAWASGNAAQQANPGAVITQGKYGASDAFFLGLDSSHHYEFYVRNAAGAQFTADSSFAPDGHWHNLAGVCDEANDVVSLYIDGGLAATNSITTASGLYEAGAPISIGAGTADGVNFVYQFLGYLNDVAVYNQALTASNVAAQYVSPGVSPSLSPAPPASVDINGGATLVIPVTSVGTPVSGYYWYDESGGTNVAAGTTNGDILNATLTYSNVPVSWNGDTLELTVTNAYGTTNVSVMLYVNTNPAQITLNLPSPVTVVQGQSYVYAIAAEGLAPLFYQWYNAGTPVAGQTNASYTVTAGAPGNTTYYVVVSNFFSVATSTVSMFTSISGTPQPLTSGYGTNVLRLNPVGYWPMHEVEAPAGGDTEANYGSLGLLGTGYYPDWAPGNGGGITRGYPGALAGDTDPAVMFNDVLIINGSSEWTNALYVPHTSPLSTLNPPFSVECWCYPRVTTGGQAVWAQFGFEGLNAGNAGSGNGNYDGAYFVYNGAFTIYGEDNGVQTALAAGGVATPINHWYHLVVTCDAGTNFIVYINGVAGSTVAGVGKYTPDYWTPLTVANGRGSGRAMECGLDEFAVYTNVISDITTHYNDGISGGPGTYFNAVTNDNPVIYFRMDSPAYSAPSTNFWPVLFNYGSAGINGYYTPGTMPGIVQGPSTNANGVPFNGLSGANVPQLSGVSSFADAGYAPAFDQTGPTPFSVSAMFRGNPCDGRVQTIVGHSTSSWGIWMDTSGKLVCYLGTNSSSLTSSGVYNDGNWHQVVAVYTPNANPALTGTGAIYVDGTLDTSVSTVSTNGIEPGSPLDVMIGTDPQFTNNPAGVGQQFAGQVCEVALFTNALTAGQISALYLATETNNIPAFFAPAPPTTASASPGGTLVVPAGAAGTTPIYYQWQFTTNGGGASVVATGSTNGLPLNATLTVPNVSAAWNAGQLELTVTNAYGTNNAFVTLSIVNPVNTNPPPIGFSVAGNLLTLSWLTNTGWQLQSQTNSLSVGITTNWVNVANTTTTNQVIIPINLTNGSVFYRLVYP